MKAKGCRRAIELAVSGPFHSSMLKPAGEKLAARLAEVELSVPGIPVVANVDVTAHMDPAEIRTVLAEQVSSPVQWVKTIQKMAADGVTDIVECGPGKVLQGLIRRIAPEIRIYGISDAATLAASLEKLKAAQ